MKRIALALDIDGVIMKGDRVIQRASESLQLLKQYKIPYVFVTNGGGITEQSKAEDMTKKLGHVIFPNQIILAHTPYRKLSSKYYLSSVLVIGSSKKCVDVLKSYGFQHIITVDDIYETFPSIYPRKRRRDSTSPMKDQKELTDIKAAFIVHDPSDWGLDMQVLTDVLIDGSPLNHTLHFQKDNHHKWQQSIPLYACNADLVYTTEYHRPRYTQGAFVEAFRHIFEKFTSTPLKVEYFGKPYSAQYRLAEEMIDKIKLHFSYTQDDTIDHYFGIGDNPASDIRGARGAGHKWSSVLVRTGIFKGSTNDEVDPADYVVDDIYDAVSLIIQSNKLTK